MCVVEGSGQACILFLVFEAYWFGGSGFGDRVSCCLELVRALTGLVKRPGLFRGAADSISDSNLPNQAGKHTHVQKFIGTSRSSQ